MDPSAEAAADQTFDALEADAAVQEAQHPEQEHPVQEAHGGSMAPGLVDDTGHRTADTPDTSGDS